MNTETTYSIALEIASRILSDEQLANRQGLIEYIDGVLQRRLSQESGNESAESVNAAQPTAVPNSELRPTPAIYVASRASVPERGQMWRSFRREGVPITSSWIDEDGAGETGDWRDLWERIENEIKDSTALVLYAEAADFPLKGALIEAGIALGFGVPVVICLPDSLPDYHWRPIGSWINHPNVFGPVSDIREAIKIALNLLTRQREGGSVSTTEGSPSSCPHLRQTYPGTIGNECLDCGARLPSQPSPELFRCGECGISYLTPADARACHGEVDGPESLTPDVQGKLVAEKSPCCGWDVRGEYIVRDKDTLECSRCGQRYVREALALLDGQNQDQKEK